MMRHSIHTLLSLLLGASCVLANELPVSVNTFHVPDKEWAEVLGVDPLQSPNSFSSNKKIHALLVGAKEPTNILWPGEKPELEIQIENLTGTELAAKARVVVVSYETFTHDGEIFKYGARKIADEGGLDVALAIPAKGFQTLRVPPPVPERFGGYAILLQIEGEPHRQFITSIARSYEPDFRKRQFYKLTMDLQDPAVLRRLGAAPNRVGLTHRPPGDPAHEAYYQKQAEILRAYAAAELPVMLEFGHGAKWTGESVPLGRNRPFLEDDGLMKDGMGDIVWLPSTDKTFTEFVKRILVDFGWPRGPVNAVKIWNEPWNGASIAGWGADDERFRELTLAMDVGVRTARKEAGVQVLQGGADSSSNSLDKYFSDGSDRFMPMFDFLSVHYQGNDPFTNYRPWLERKDADGKANRVLFWDTESWVGNTDDRIASTLATMYSFGQDRAVGIDSGRTVVRNFERKVMLPDGGSERRVISHAYGSAAAVGAFQKLIGEDRPFHKLLWHGLPFVLQFDGRTRGADDPSEDGTFVIVGDMGFLGADNVALRTARSLAEVAGKRALREQLAGLVADSKERRIIQDRLLVAWPHTGATLTVAADGDRFTLLDFYGNPVPAVAGKFTIPLSVRGYYLRGNGQPGSFAALAKAIENARVDGMEPLEKKIHDFTARIEDRPVLRIELRNVLNQPLTGKIHLSVKGLELSYPKDLSFAPHESKIVEARVTVGASNPENLYPLSFRFDAGKGLVTEHFEEMRVNLISRRSVKVDGDLRDWEGVLPQTIRLDENSSATMTEKAWRPFDTFDEGPKKGLSIGYLAWDDRNFYFATRIADASEHPGALRFETRDDDEFFYPEVSYRKRSQNELQSETLRWPAGVRRFSYRKDPMVPAGHGIGPVLDNVQIGFNVLPEERKPKITTPPGLIPGYLSHSCTDYEWALNRVAETYGGGTEVWRLRRPGMAHKHFFPRQLKSPEEGPAKGAELVVKYDNSWHIVEAAIPWSEMPEAKALLDAGKTVKFSYRVNDDQGVGCMELAKRRSVSKRNPSFFVDWAEHWANELEFAAEKP